jgi:SAM-dependent methyltransferase
VLESVYDKSYFESMRGKSSEGSSLYDGFLKMLPEPADHVRWAILDAGCGRGELISLLHRRGFSEVQGVDFSADAISLAAHNFPGLKSRLRRGSLLDRSLYDEATFDFIFMTDVVEHIAKEDLPLAIANARFWLKPGGSLLIHTFPTAGPHELFRCLLWLTNRREYLGRLDQIHCSVQTPASLRTLLAKGGFQQMTLWLQNDLVKTSSAYQQLPSGMVKSVAKFLLNDVPGFSWFRKLARALRLEPWFYWSIYARAIKD